MDLKWDCCSHCCFKRSTLHFQSQPLSQCGQQFFNVLRKKGKFEHLQLHDNWENNGAWGEIVLQTPPEIYNWFVHHQQFLTQVWERHGKSSCAAVFNRIQTWLKDELLVWENMHIILYFAKCQTISLIWLMVDFCVISNHLYLKIISAYSKE